MAITIDDVPWVGARRADESAVDATGRIIAALRRHGVTATAFVNCDRVGPDDPVIRAWLDGGQGLGNHTAGHLDLNRAAVERWLSEARSCHRYIEPLVDGPVWFRFPYLHTGPTADRRAAAYGLLAELGSPIARVTIDNSDWILASAYGRAIRTGDEALQREIGREFIEHIVRATGHFRGVAEERLGRDVAHVLLLHANALVADWLDPLLERLRDEGIRFVALAEAKRDPVYRLPDGYTGPDGLSWLYRFEPAVPELKAWDDAEADALRRRFPQQ